MKELQKGKSKDHSSYAEFPALNSDEIYTQKTNKQTRIVEMSRIDMQALSFQNTHWLCPRTKRHREDR